MLTTDTYQRTAYFHTRVAAMRPDEVPDFDIDTDPPVQTDSYGRPFTTDAAIRCTEVIR